MKARYLIMLVTVAVLGVALYSPGDPQAADPNSSETLPEGYGGVVEGLAPRVVGYADWMGTGWSYAVAPVESRVCTVFYGDRVVPIFNTTQEWLGATDGQRLNEFYATAADGWLYAINPHAQTVRQIGNYGGPTIRELGYKEINGILYGTDYDDLYVINLVTGVATLKGAMGGVGEFWAMDYHAGVDKLLAISDDTDRLYEVNVENGNLTEIGPTGADRISDIWYDKDSGNLYGVSDEQGGDHHYIIDPNNGQAAPLAGGASFGYNLCGLGDVGTLLTGACCVPDSGCVDSLTRVECKALNGYYVDDGITCDVVECPTLTQWGLIILVVLILFSTWVVLRRRKAAVSRQ